MVCEANNQNSEAFWYQENKKGLDGLFLSGFPAKDGRGDEIHKFGQTFQKYFFVTGDGPCCGVFNGNAWTASARATNGCVDQVLNELQNYTQIIAVSRSNVVLLEALGQKPEIPPKTKITMVAPEIPDESYLNKWKQAWEHYSNSEFHIHYSEADPNSEPLLKLNEQFKNVTFYKYSVVPGTYEYVKDEIRNTVTIKDNKGRNDEVLMGHGTLQKSFMDYYKSNPTGNFRKDIFIQKNHGEAVYETVNVSIHVQTSNYIEKIEKTSNYIGKFRAEGMVQQLFNYVQ